MIKTGSVLAVLAAATAVAAGPAQAAPADLECTATQVATELIPGGGAAGVRAGYLQITALPGEACTLAGVAPVRLVGAHDVLVGHDAPADTPTVYLRDGSSAYVRLTWTARAPWRQQTPLAVSIEPDSRVGEPVITADWTLGPVDATWISHTIHVGPATAGPAPRS
ncbi:hypothetical protein GCM10017786_23080 [Amycolatopsis deserti]|uniref:DUF4232 domain-containing protein n=1 Tax=Amycolatopsis deserti TaxID=185696 RepID=A0ABQ3IV83_9PSEU|nr:DUF4232 domain-containing protein [Amycolatopsis deserti]GHE90198.1 hypothetical protein GCM10017786_23080 [Amycolatopsis deserti]